MQEILYQWRVWKDRIQYKFSQNREIVVISPTFMEEMLVSNAQKKKTKRMIQYLGWRIQYRETNAENLV